MLLKEDDYQLLEEYLTRVFGKIYGRLDGRISRWALKLEPLNPETYPKGNTRQCYRWELPENPPAKLAYLADLFASERDCYSAKHRLMAQIVFMGDAPVRWGLFDDVSQLRERLLTYDPTLAQGVLCSRTKQPITIADIRMALKQSSSIGSSEINIDYTNHSENGNRLDPNDLNWIKPSYYLYALRKAVSDATNLKSLLDKIQTKAYLTDRKQTGDDPSNRERRWEVSPRDPQFALHQECIRIEAKLFAQIFEMSGAPTVHFPEEMLKVIMAVTQSNLIPGNFSCPISGQLIGYDEFIQKVTVRVHGKSPYQVAHLTPLADEGGGGKHIAENISWITDLGNRVQGNDSIEKIVEEIFSMATYHKNRLGLTWQEVELRAKAEKEKEKEKIS